MAAKKKMLIIDIEYFLLLQKFQGEGRLVTDPPTKHGLATRSGNVRLALDVPQHGALHVINVLEQELW